MSIKAKVKPTLCAASLLIVLSCIVYQAGKDPVGRVLVAWAVVMGASVGSFMTVLFHRSPIMLANLKLRMAGTKTEPYNLFYPKSSCPGCGSNIAWHYNIPLLSYIWLRGHGACCGYGIKRRYFVLECVFMAAALVFVIAYRDIILKFWLS